MTTSITLKNAANVDVIFDVVRQPSGNTSAILYERNATPGMNRTGLAKIELSARVVNGRSAPVASVTVPYGTMKDGNFVKIDQVSDVRSSTQPASTPMEARSNAAAFGANLAQNAQVKALFESGLIS